jgi:hypothetical protein
MKKTAPFLLGALLWLTVQPAASQLLSGLLPTARLSDLTVTLVDLDTAVGSFTITNVTGGGQSITVDSVLMVYEFVGITASATCRVVSFFSNLAPGTVIPAGASVNVDYTVVCDQGTPPLDTFQVMNLLMVRLVGSNKVWASSGMVHL